MAGVLSGRKIGFAIGLEGARGVAVGPQYGLPHLDSDFKPRREKVINDSAIGVLARDNDAAVVKEWAEGDVNVKFTPNGGGLLLLAGFGSVVSAANADVSGVVADHTFSMSDLNEQVSLTMVRKETNANERYPMATLRKWELEVVVGEYIKTNTGIISKAEVTGTDVIAFATETEFTPKYATLKRAANLAGLAAATPIKARRFRVTIEKTVEPDYVFGSNSPDNIFVQEYTVSGEMELRYESREHYDLYKADTKNALELDVVNTDVTIGTAARPRLRLQLPTISVDEWDVDQAKDSIVTQTVGFKGLYDLATARAIQALLTNTVMTYAAGTP